MAVSDSEGRQADTLSQHGAVIDADQRLQIKIAHLSMLQGVIARMAGDGQSMKTLAITISGAIIAVSPVGGNTALILAIAGIVALVFFWWQTAYNLHVERAYRHLYDKIRRDEAVPAFTMDWRSCRLEVDSPVKLAVSASVLVPFLAMLVLLVVLTLTTLSGFLTAQASGVSLDGEAAQRASRYSHRCIDGGGQIV